MKKFAVSVGALVVIGFAGFMGLTMPAAWEITHPSRDAPDAGVPDIANGKTMFLAGDCAVCHSSLNQNDATKLGGGRSLSSAFGTFYMPNISSDAKDGIGGWTAPQLIRAIIPGVAIYLVSAHER
jgi:mono/diheme cytochrome c family protein